MVEENEYIREGDETMATEKELRIRLAHIGINAKDDMGARRIAEQFVQALGLSITETPISYFNGSLIEVMKENGRGVHGHIGLAVDDCEAALLHFAERGLTVAEETKRFDEDGHCIFAYFNEEIAGFALHLIQE